MRGEPYQFFLNTPWGENLENQFAKNYTSFSSRFRFNGKEWDEETGNFYYGARYYDPNISVWLSVDPLAHKYPSLSSYAFVANNPIIFVDPDGKRIVFAKNSSVSFRLKVSFALTMGWLFSSNARRNINTVLFDGRTHTIHQHHGPTEENGKPHFGAGSHVKPKNLETWQNNYPEGPAAKWDERGYQTNKNEQEDFENGTLREYKNSMPTDFFDRTGDDSNVYLNLDKKVMEYGKKYLASDLTTTVLHEIFHSANISNGVVDYNPNSENPSAQEEQNAVNNVDQSRADLNNARKYIPFLKLIIPQEYKMRENY